jgi:hypothetical protein
MRSPAASHRLTYSTTQRASVCASTTLITLSQGTLSKNFRMSNSTTQSYRKHRSRHIATASRADLPGRYPYESRWNTGSTRTDRCSATTVCATRSATQGTPRILVPPAAFRIATAFTSGGK